MRLSVPKPNTHCKILTNKVIWFGMLWCGILLFKQHSKCQIFIFQFCFRRNVPKPERERMKATAQFYCTHLQKHMFNISLEIMVTPVLSPAMINMYGVHLLASSTLPVGSCHGLKRLENVRLFYKNCHSRWIYQNQMQRYTWTNPNSEQEQKGKRHMWLLLEALCVPEPNLWRSAPITCS